MLLYSDPLSLNFPAVALSCFPIRETGEEKDPQVVQPFPPWTLWLILPTIHLLDVCPASFPGGRVASRALAELWPVAELPGDPTLATQVPLLAYLFCPSPLLCCVVSERHRHLACPRWPLQKQAEVSQPVNGVVVPLVRAAATETHTSPPWAAFGSC